MITNAIARRYAKALVQLGVEEGAVAKFNDELAGFVGQMTANAELRSVFANPAYGIESKREILGELVGRLALSPTMKNFLLLLLDRGRISYVAQIAASYGILADALSGVVRPTLTTAMPLDDAQVAEIKASLEKMTGSKVFLKVEQDASLIGGIVAKIGDKVFDGSIRTQLNRIEDILQKG